MSEYLLLVAGGLLGSAHCVGMCGVFPWSLAAHARSGRGNLLRQLSYTCGRLFGYGVAGTAAGYAGWRLMQSASWLGDVQAWLAIAAGVLLVVQGLISAGVLRVPPGWFASAGVCLLAQLFADLRQAASPRLVVLHAGWLGMLTALMPCGLLYAYLALAASSGHPLSGLAVMLAFGAGTAPLMIAWGMGAGALSLSWRQRAWRAAAWCVVLTGVLALARGGAALAATESTPACPLCAASGRW